MLPADPRLPLTIGAVLISLSPVWVRLVDVPPTVSAFYRVAIGGIALTLILVLSRRRLELSPRILIVLFAGGACFALDLWAWHRSILYIGPGLATLLGNFQVFFMMVAGLLFLGQKPQPMQWVAVPLALGGLALLVGPDWETLTTEYRSGVWLGLLTAVAYTGYLLSLRAARSWSRHKLPDREVAVVSLATALLLGAVIGLEGQDLAITRLEDAGWLLAYGLLSHTLGWLLIASSLPRVTTTEAGLALLLQPALSFAWDILLFGRSVSAMEASGAAVALLAIYLGSRSQERK